MRDLIDREEAANAPRQFIKGCNPEYFVGHQKFIKYMDDAEIGSFGQWQFANGFNTGLTAAEVAIKALPSAQPEKCEDCGNFNKTRLVIPQPERKGKWKGYNADDPNWLRTDGSPAFLICSECGQVVVNNFSAHWNYCSNCGAKMEREQKHLDNKSDLVILDEVKGE